MRVHPLYSPGSETKTTGHRFSLALWRVGSLKEDEMIAVQVNGKTVTKVATTEEAETFRPTDTVRTVQIPGRIINFVTR